MSLRNSEYQHTKSVTISPSYEIPLTISLVYQDSVPRRQSISSQNTRHLSESTNTSMTSQRRCKKYSSLKKKMPSSHTSLVLETLSETPFAPGLAQGAYRDILRSYEFRSLLPAQPPTVAIPEKPVDTINIESTKALAQLQSDIMDQGGPVILSTDAYGKIVI